MIFDFDSSINSKTSLGRTSIIDIDGFLFFYMLNHIHPYEIVNGVVEFQGVPEEVKTEQKDKDVEGVF